VLFFSSSFPRAFGIGLGLALFSGFATAMPEDMDAAPATVQPTEPAEPAAPQASQASEPASSDTPATKKSGKGKDSEKEDLPRKVKSTSHLTVIAKDLKFNEARTQQLLRIADRYYLATKKRLVVTGGTRTPDKQAQLMVAKFLHGDAVERLYENRTAFKEIKKAFEAARSETKSRNKLAKAIREVIIAQVARGEFISKHLQFAATDIRSHGMTPEREAAFKAAVAAESGVTLLDERDGPEAHFHLSF
jgi:hypothetical protein